MFLPHHFTTGPVAQLSQPLPHPWRSTEHPFQLSLLEDLGDGLSSPTIPIILHPFAHSECFCSRISFALHTAPCGSPHLVDAFSAEAVAFRYVSLKAAHRDRLNTAKQFYQN